MNDLAFLSGQIISQKPMMKCREPMICTAVSRRVHGHPFNLRHVVVINCIGATIVPFYCDASPVSFADRAAISETFIPLNAVVGF
jgi:hypothetical protein